MRRGRRTLLLPASRRHGPDNNAMGSLCAGGRAWKDRSTSSRRTDRNSCQEGSERQWNARRVWRQSHRQTGVQPHTRRPADFRPQSAIRCFADLPYKLTPTSAATSSSRSQTRAVAFGPVLREYTHASILCGADFAFPTIGTANSNRVYRI
jgi:hypothetical protein